MLDKQQQWPIVGCWSLRRVNRILILCRVTIVGTWHGVLELKQASIVGQLQDWLYKRGIDQINKHIEDKESQVSSARQGSQLWKRRK